MKQLRTLTQAIALASLMSAASISVHAEEVLIGAKAIQDTVDTKVLAVDAANHQVTLEGVNNSKVPFQLTDKAQNLDKLKVGDSVKIHITRSVAIVLDTDVGTKAPTASAEEGVIRAVKGSPNPGGEAFRQVKVTSKIESIDMKKHEVTLMPPEGKAEVVHVKDPELQKKMGKLEKGQTVDVVYTDTVKVTTKH